MGRGTSATELRVWPNFRLRCSVLPIPESYLFVLARTPSPVCSVRPYLNSVCSIWPISRRRSVLSSPYPILCLFCLAHTLTSVCSVWPMPFFGATPKQNFSQLTSLGANIKKVSSNGHQTNYLNLSKP